MQSKWVKQQGKNRNVMSAKSKSKSNPTIDRRSFLKTVGGVSASMLLSPVAELRAAEPSGQNSTSAAGKKPNFLVVVADDQCFRSINTLNNREVHTPTFDRLLKRGTVFTHSFHQGSWTGAVCVASRAMLHTGRHVWTCGGNDCGYYPLLGEAMQMGGYDTYVVGKWHNGDETALRSFTTGKTIGPGFYASTPVKGLAYNRPRPGDPWTPWDPKYRGHWTPYDLWDIEHPAHNGLWISQHGPIDQNASDRYERQQHSCELYADSAVELLQRTASRPDRPFFLYVAWNSPHDPRQAPKEFLDLYPADKIEVPPNFLPQHPFDQGDFDCRDEKLAPFPRTPHDVQVHRREYYASITYMDKQLGRIIDALEKTGQADNTCIIITGDHGLAVGEHGLMGKQNLYDCSVRMPFIMAGPGITAGRRIDAMMYQHCLFPTVCDLAGISTPATVQFPSLLPLLRGERESLFDSIYSAYRGYQRMVRTSQYKLILYPEVKKVQLFDIEKDPWETNKNNLAGEPAHASTIAELFRELKKWQGTVNDTLVLDPATFGIKA
jgi:arylsulfatase A-like enzyme